MKKEECIINFDTKDYENLSLDELDTLINKVKNDILLLKYADSNKEYISEVLALVEE